MKTVAAIALTLRPASHASFLAVFAAAIALIPVGQKIASFPAQIFSQGE